jgi:hypothetical protein
MVELIFYLWINSLSELIIKFILFILNNAFKKEKDLIKDFLLFDFPLILKRTFKPFINQLNYQKLKECFLSLLAPILVHWTHMWVLDARKLNIIENNKGYLVI